MRKLNGVHTFNKYTKKKNYLHQTQFQIHILKSYVYTNIYQTILYPLYLIPDETNHCQILYYFSHTEKQIRSS